MRAVISHGKVSGRVKAPSSKSYSQRYIILSGLTEGVKKIDGLSFSDDEQIAIDIIRRSGSFVEYAGRSITVTSHFRCPDEVSVGESATSYRLSIGALSGKGCVTAFVGDKGLSSRPADELASALRQLSIDIRKKSDGFLEIDARSGKVDAVEIDATVSSQFISSLLFYYSFIEGDNKRLILKGEKSSPDYIRITVECLRKFGVDVSEDSGGYIVRGVAGRYDGEIVVEGDYSSSAFLLVLGILASNDGISVEGLDPSSIQGDREIIEMLKGNSDGISTEIRDGKYTLVSKKSPIGAIDVDVNRVPDLAPPLSVIGIFSENGVRLRNYGRLAIKESNRADEIIRLARSFGAQVEVDEESILIKKGSAIRNPKRLQFYDHRMIMSAIIAGIASGFEISYENVEKINKSYPDFMNDIGRLGSTIRFDLE